MFFDALDRNLAHHPNGEQSRQFFRSRFEVCTCENHFNLLTFPVHIVFFLQGTCQQIVTCTCGKRNTTELPLCSLPLHIDGFNSLTNALANYFMPEELSDCCCDMCGHVGNVTKSSKRLFQATCAFAHSSFLVECVTVPPVLMLQLNRYMFDSYVSKFICILAI